MTVADCSNGSKARDCRQYRPGTSSRPIAEIVIRRCMGCLEIARWREQLNSVRKYIECVRTHPSLRAIADVLSWCCWVAALATCTLDLLDLLDLPVAISFAQCVVLAPCDGARWNCGDVVTPRVLSGAADRLGYAGEKSLIAAIGRKLHIVEITTVDSASCDPFAVVASVQVTPVACISAASLALTCNAADALFFAGASGADVGTAWGADSPAVQAFSASARPGMIALRKAGDARNKWPNWVIAT